MTKKSFILLVVCVLIIPISAFSASQIKIGFVDQQQVFEKSKLGQGIEQQVKALQDSKQVKINEMQKEIEELDNKIKNKDLPITDQNREEMRKEKRKKEIDLKYFVDDAYEEGNKLSSSLMKKFDDKIKLTVKKISEEGGFTIVIEKTGIIFYGSPEFDITEKVIAEINKSGE
jgi:outer membrane protein